MLFNSFEFLALLALTFVLYYLPMPGRRQWQVGLLLVSSALFYGWGAPELLPLLALSCLLNAAAAGRILRLRRQGEDAPARRTMKATVIANLGLLALFKYAGFFAGQVPGLPPTWVEWARGIPLPVGISFYTFQGISLVIDVWRRDVSEATEERFVKTGRGRVAVLRDASFYVAFFPQLVAGPIVKAREFFDQIGGKAWSEIDWITVRRGLVMGYFLKIFVADNLAEQTGLLVIGEEGLRSFGPVGLMAMLYGYGLQIFADFAGYSLIAIGLGALFGYRLPPNFHFPYISTSLTEFWRRWHLSLSSWLRDYLYIPLGGNRKGSARTYLNLFLVMFLGGLWHGAEWKFAFWGGLHGGFLALERLLGRRNRRENEGPGWVAILKGFYAFHVVTFLWLTFLMPDLQHILGFFRALGSEFQLPGQPLFALGVYGGVVVLYHLWGWLRERRSRPWMEHPPILVEGALHALMIFLIVTNPGAPRGFIYFQF
ncbi:alginate O-acetyltransferase complex protein AlgI [Haloferula luteola]|uniref:Alginate O-acetyltransferase complex protein AlgI n=1 Tax=Haloferula luteola TaxID=595692 RepID=A0A840V7E4_9BACT|nr:MBOAT family protein [Haloferula luteola]MBB5353633.1 alginate O-acetyltransferase complex protein AlgI [Haloferula luteola]